MDASISPVVEDTDRRRARDSVARHVDADSVAEVDALLESGLASYHLVDLFAGARALDEVLWVRCELAAP